MIGVDWGTTSLRAWRLAPDGALLGARTSAQGILAITNRQFGAVLRNVVGDWVEEGETRILMCGMIGSRQGWVEVPYITCPAGIADIAAGLTPIAFDGAQVMIVPGLLTIDRNEVPDLMRGEETQILGMVHDRAARRVVCLPGTHSKWALIEKGRIQRFSTFMTGEIFSALAAHTILARTIQAGPIDAAAFASGVIRATEPGGLLHHAFGVRTRALRLEVSEADSYAYLSGLMIGHELNVALGDQDGMVSVVGASALAGLYVDAIRSRGRVAMVIDETIGAAGLAQLEAYAAWT